MNNRFYALKIKLMDIDPPIWRDFAVPADITLDRLHDVVQIVMGWTDSHLYQFTIGKKRYTEHIESEFDGLDSGKYRLGPDGHFKIPHPWPGQNPPPGRQNKLNLIS